MINTTDLVRYLGTDPAYLLRCAPWLTTEQIRLLQQPGPDTWTTARLPLLGAAHHPLGDADRARRAQRRRAERTSELKRRQQVIDDNITRRRP